MSLHRRLVKLVILLEDEALCLDVLVEVLGLVCQIYIYAKGSLESWLFVSACK